MLVNVSLDFYYWTVFIKVMDLFKHRSTGRRTFLLNECKWTVGNRVAVRFHTPRKACSKCSLQPPST